MIVKLCGGSFPALMDPSVVCTIVNYVTICEGYHLLWPMIDPAAAGGVDTIINVEGKIYSRLFVSTQQIHIR